MSCGCKSSGDSTHNCGTKSTAGCPSIDTCGNSYKLSVFDWLSNIKQPSTEHRETAVEVRFKNDRKSFYKNTSHLPLQIGSVVAVESNPGHDIGVVSLTGELVKIQMKKKKFSDEFPLKILRIANQKDIDLWTELRKKEESIKRESRRIAQELHLDMKISDVEYQGDGSKITFYYISNGRVDFRQLIKEYASVFKTKVDMKQIGFRQEVAKIGGIGVCGRELCCSSWLTDFRSVNTNAARYQQLSINPQKLAGQCGKLKCCLNFELDSYMEALSVFPPTNSSLDTVNGRAFCIKIDVFKRKMWFVYADNMGSWYDIDAVRVADEIANNKKGIKAPPLEEMVDAVEKDIKVNVDLIQENSVDRFEKRNPERRRKNGGKGRANKTNFQQHQDKTAKPQVKEKSTNKNSPNDRNASAPKGDRNKPTNFKRRPPKKDNNA